MDAVLKRTLTKKKRFRPPSRRTLLYMACLFVSSLCFIVSVLEMGSCHTPVAIGSDVLSCIVNGWAAGWSWNYLLSSWERDQRD